MTFAQDGDQPFRMVSRALQKEGDTMRKTDSEETSLGVGRLIPLLGLWGFFWLLGSWDTVIPEVTKCLRPAPYRQGEA